jgi:hypothetical protein
MGTGDDDGEFGGSGSVGRGSVSSLTGTATGRAYPTTTATPLHRRKYTTHLYFSHTLREVIADKDSVVVLIPQPSTEQHLRKRMFSLYKERNLRSVQDYERQLRTLVEEEAAWVDVPYCQWVGKRYVYLKSELAAGHVTLGQHAPVDAGVIATVRAKAHADAAAAYAAYKSNPTAASTSTGKDRKSPNSAKRVKAQLGTTSLATSASSSMEMDNIVV